MAEVGRQGAQVLVARLAAVRLVLFGQEVDLFWGGGGGHGGELSVVRSASGGGGLLGVVLMAGGERVALTVLVSVVAGGCCCSQCYVANKFQVLKIPVIQIKQQQQHT